MKKGIVTILGCTALLFSGYALSWTDSDSGGCSGGSCGSGYCDPYQSTCQCTDPSCNQPYDQKCISRGYCCEAFGNIGAR